MGFIQAKDSYRFSSDALLLADFACTYLSKNIFEKKRGIKAPFLFLDLGCGCGVIGVQILKYIQKNYPDRIKDTYILGIDKERALVESANANAQAFGFCENYYALCGDINPNMGAGTSTGMGPNTGTGASKNRTICAVADFSATLNQNTCEKAIQGWALDKMKKYNEKRKNSPDGVDKNPRLFDAVITNPPWYDMNNGKVSHALLRRSALFGDGTSIATFLGFAEKKLKKNASLYMVGKSSNFADCAKLMPAPLRCTTMQNVHAKEGVAAVFFLLEARFQSKADMVFPAPIFLDTKDL